MADNSVTVKIEADKEDLAKELAKEVGEEVSKRVVSLTKLFEMYMGENQTKPLLDISFKQGEIDTLVKTQNDMMQKLSGINPGNFAQTLKELEPMWQNTQALIDRLNNAKMEELVKLDFSKLNLTELAEAVNQLKVTFGNEDLISMAGLDPATVDQSTESVYNLTSALGTTSKTLDEVQNKQTKATKGKYWLQESTGILKSALESVNEDAIVEQIYTGKGDAAMTAMASEIIRFAQLRSMSLMVDGTYYAAMAFIDRNGILLTDGIPYSTKAAHAFATAAVLGALSYGAIQGGEMKSALYGKAHDGFDSIPYEGTWLLDKGERVVDSRTNADLKQFLSNKSRGDINLTVNINGGDKDSVMEALPALQKIIKDVVVGDIVSGGQIKRVIKEYR